MDYFRSAAPECYCTDETLLTGMMCRFADLNFTEQSRAVQQEYLKVYEKRKARIQEQIDNLRAQAEARRKSGFGAGGSGCRTGGAARAAAGGDARDGAPAAGDSYGSGYRTRYPDAGGNEDGGMTAKRTESQPDGAGLEPAPSFQFYDYEREISRWRA